MRRRPYVQDGLTREDFTEERIAALERELSASGAMIFLDPDVREASRREILARQPEGEDLWVFGYGSLMWNPAVHCAETAPALLHGWHRQFCLWTPLGRGTPERPGLMLGLEPGGCCRGMALRLEAGLIESETAILWRREMLSGAYRPRWVSLTTRHGRVPAVTFTVNRAHPRYGGRVPQARAVQAIATAEGQLGRCRDYLHNMILHLDELGIADGPMHRLYDLVEAYHD
ncbi:MAG TPA: gamma-glutamylcyclotransferase [Alphaproteobacteria bacterium]|nr:gamma-glutamylcyclotransferase [Alphaproteobacteria bacterium]